MNKYAIELKWGIIFTIVFLLWIVVEKLWGLHGPLISKQLVYTNIFSVIAVVLFVFGMREKREKFYGGKMTWKEGMMTGLMIGVVVMMLSPFAQIITHKVISPEYFPNMIAHLVEIGDAPDVETAAKTVNLKSYIMKSTVFSLIAGAVTGAVVAIFLKKS